MSNERAYIVYMKGCENQVTIGDTSYTIQTEMLTIAVWAETPTEAKRIAEEMKFEVEYETEIDKKHSRQVCYDIVAITPSLLSFKELSE